MTIKKMDRLVYGGSGVAIGLIIRWVVGDKPSGPFGWAQTRSWPWGYVNENLVFLLSCEDTYTPARARGQEAHWSIKMSFDDRRDGKRRSLVQRAVNLTEAKKLALDKAREDTLQTEAKIAARKEEIARLKGDDISGKTITSPPPADKKADGAAPLSPTNVRPGN